MKEERRSPLSATVWRSPPGGKRREAYIRSLAPPWGGKPAGPPLTPLGALTPLDVLERRWMMHTSNCHRCKKVVDAGECALPASTNRASSTTRS